jgi:hypothetical protein
VKKKKRKDATKGDDTSTGATTSDTKRNVRSGAMRGKKSDMKKDVTPGARKDARTDEIGGVKDGASAKTTGSAGTSGSNTELAARKSGCEWWGLST